MSPKKKYGPSSPVDEQRLLVLTDHLRDGSLPSLSFAELKALAEHLVKTDQPLLLGRLHSHAAGKEQRKIVNQALYRLKKRGVDVPEVRIRPKVVDLTTQDKPTPQPILFAQPELNGERLFFFPHGVRQQYLLIRVGFHPDDGLAVLRGEETSRSDYQAMVKGLTSPLASQIPQGWILADVDLIQRKLWEVGTFVRSGRIGREVDRDLVTLLRLPQDPPPHPVTGLDLDQVTAADEDVLLQAVEALRPLSDEKIFDQLVISLHEASTSLLVLSEAQQDERLMSLIRAAISELVKTWGADTLAEVFLDTALYQYLTGHPDIAKAMRSIATAPETSHRDYQIRAFMALYLEHLFLKADENSPGPEPRSPGGIILP